VEVGYIPIVQSAIDGQCTKQKQFPIPQGQIREKNIWNHIEHGMMWLTGTLPRLKLPHNLQHDPSCLKCCLREIFA